MAEQTQQTVKTGSNVPAPLVAVAGWVLPGLGYWLIGQRARAVVVFVTIMALFGAGVLIAGIRVIDVPGYGNDGQLLKLATGPDSQGRVVEFRSDRNKDDRPAPRSEEELRWRPAIVVHPFTEVLNKPWYIGQVLVGPVALVASKVSLGLTAPGAAYKAHVRVWEIGTLYTAVAGMLNLLVMIDAAHRVSVRKGDQ
jgi:hypothetical protein